MDMAVYDISPMCHPCQIIMLANCNFAEMRIDELHVLSNSTFQKEAETVYIILAFFPPKAQPKKVA